MDILISKQEQEMVKRAPEKAPETMRSSQSMNCHG